VRLALRLCKLVFWVTFILVFELAELAIEYSIRFPLGG